MEEARKFTNIMDRDQLLKDYARIIDEQTEKIKNLHTELEYYRGFAEHLGATKAVSQRDKVIKELEEIEQILGEVLGYPWYKDDQENFPNATEAEGVCVGHETAWSLAANAAYWLKKYKEENQKLREGLSLAASNIGNGSGASPQASVEFLTVDVPAEVKLVCQNYRGEIEFLKARLK